MQQATPPVTDQQLADSLALCQSEENEYVAARKKAESECSKLTRLIQKQGYYHFLRRFRDVGKEYALWPIGVILVLPFAASAFIWAVGSTFTLPFLLNLFIAFLACATVVGVCVHLLWIPNDANLLTLLLAIDSQVIYAKSAVSHSQVYFAEKESRFKLARQQYAELLNAIEQWQERQRQELARYRASIQYKQEQLLQTNWRAMRGVEFELFLKLVFETYGYLVETTRTTGDQGADLIVCRNGRRTAIQVKGYLDSVSNGAVQEAYAGKGYYRCDACAVITNSRFTPSARDLASKLECRLIDEALMRALIMGEITL